MKRHHSAAFVIVSLIMSSMDPLGASNVTNGNQSELFRSNLNLIVLPLEILPAKEVNQVKEDTNGAHLIQSMSPESSQSTHKRLAQCLLVAKMKSHHRNPPGPRKQALSPLEHNQRDDYKRRSRSRDDQIDGNMAIIEHDRQSMLQNSGMELSADIDPPSFRPWNIMNQRMSADIPVATNNNRQDPSDQVGVMQSQDDEVEILCQKLFAMLQKGTNWKDIHRPTHLIKPSVNSLRNLYTPVLHALMDKQATLNVNHMHKHCTWLVCAHIRGCFDQCIDDQHDKNALDQFFLSFLPIVRSNPKSIVSIMQSAQKHQKFDFIHSLFPIDQMGTMPKDEIILAFEGLSMIMKQALLDNKNFQFDYKDNKADDGMMNWAAHLLKSTPVDIQQRIINDAWVSGHSIFLTKVLASMLQDKDLYSQIRALGLLMMFMDRSMFDPVESWSTDKEKDLRNRSQDSLWHLWLSHTDCINKCINMLLDSLQSMTNFRASDANRGMLDALYAKTDPIGRIQTVATFNSFMLQSPLRASEGRTDIAILEPSTIFRLFNHLPFRDQKGFLNDVVLKNCPSLLEPILNEYSRASDRTLKAEAFHHLLTMMGTLIPNVAEEEEADLSIYQLLMKHWTKPVLEHYFYKGCLENPAETRYDPLRDIETFWRNACAHHKTRLCEPFLAAIQSALQTQKAQQDLCSRSLQQALANLLSQKISAGYVSQQGADGHNVLGQAPVTTNVPQQNLPGIIRQPGPVGGSLFGQGPAVCYDFWPMPNWNLYVPLYHSILCNPAFQTVRR